MDDGLVVQVLFWNDCVDDFVEDFLSEFAQRDLVTVLYRNYNCVDSLGDASSVVEGIFASNLKIPTYRLKQKRGFFRTCVLESGLAHQNWPFLLSSAILWLSLCAKTTVKGIHSSVSSVA